MSVHNRTRRQARAAARPVVRFRTPPAGPVAAIAARYPDPPVYVDDNARQPVPPACYAPGAVARPLIGKKPERIQQWPQAWRRRGSL